MKSGKINGKAAPTVSRKGCVVSVDGDCGMAPLSQQIGIPELTTAAKELGMAALAIRRTHHFAALWPETESLAAQGLVAMAFVNSPPYVAPAGGKVPFWGTNPMSFAWPRPDGQTMVWDQASAAMARGEIQLAERDGHALPPGAGIDSDGNPTTDPTAALAGAQLPFGGYKGSAIAMMVDLMCGPLIGEVSSWQAGQDDDDDGGPATRGELILAFNPEHFGTSTAGAEKMFSQLLGMDGVRLPGDRRRKNRQRTEADGIEIPQSLHQHIVELTVIKSE